MCFATSEVVQLGYQCSLNLTFRDLAVSPTYTASHSSHLILYTGPTMFSLLIGAFGFTNNCLSVIVGLKYVAIPYIPNTCLSCSENPCMYGITTKNLVFLSLMFPFFPFPSHRHLAERPKQHHWDVRTKEADRSQ